MGLLEGVVRAGQGFFENTAAYFGRHMGGLDSRFLFPGALILLLFLIPFLILYLIRPKPQERAISSIMFLIKDTGKSFIKSFFRTLVRDPLFFIQLLLLLFIIFAAARPFVTIPETSIDRPTVIIIDGSASMQAQHRFSDAQAIAQENLASLNTVIVAKNIPETAGIEQGKRKSSAIIASLSPGDTGTNLYDAILLAPSYLKEPGRVIVISDFATDTTYLNAKKFVESTGHKVYLKRVGTQGKNAGIVDLDVKDRSTVMTLKNYNAEEATVKVKVNGDLIETKALPAFSSDVVTFTTPGGIGTVTIEPDDDFMLDNAITTSAPENKTVSALIISNDPKIASYDFILALDAINSNSTTHITWEVAAPPKVVSTDHDLIIYKNVNRTLLLPGTVDDTVKRVKNGGAAVIMIQDDLFDINFGELLPYAFKSKELEGIVEKSGTVSLTDNVDFGTVGAYFVLDPSDKVTTVAAVAGSPIVGFSPLGKGKAMWYGIFDESADFSKDPYYPIFWKRSIDFLAGKPDVRDLNLKTGSVVAITKQRVTTPAGDVTTSSLYLDRQGIYVLSDKKVAANLLSVDESAINPTAAVIEQAQEAIDEKPHPEPFDLATYLIIAALAMIGIEILYLKFRGDL